MPFSADETYRAWMKAGGRCQCHHPGHGHDTVRCNRPLLWQNRGIAAPGGWEAVPPGVGSPWTGGRPEIYCLDCSGWAENKGTKGGKE